MLLLLGRAMSRISGLRNDMNKKTFYKERKINNRCFDFLSKQNIIVPLILDINDLLSKFLYDRRINHDQIKLISDGSTRLSQGG